MHNHKDIQDSILYSNGGRYVYESLFSSTRVGEGTELLDEVPCTLLDKIRNISVTSRGSNMAVDSSKQKRGLNVKSKDNKMI